jgi:hypothetical protein
MFSHQLKKRLATLTNNILSLKTLQSGKFYQTKDFIEKELVSVNQMIQRYYQFSKTVFFVVKILD